MLRSRLRKYCTAVCRVARQDSESAKVQSSLPVDDSGRRILYRAGKRTLDVTASFIGLLVLAPLLIPIVIALRLTGEGEIFYRQQRLGLNNRFFSILKFATMLKNSPNMAGGEITLSDDPRITPMGSFLRRTKINELPQLCNVLVGDMSLVGPRPLLEVSYLMYSIDVQAIVYRSKPGLTGIASLVFRNEDVLVSASGEDPRHFYRTVIYPYKGELEAWYYANKSLAVDLKILLLTVWYLFAPQSKIAYAVLRGIPQRPDVIQRILARGEAKPAAKF